MSVLLAIRHTPKRHTSAVTEAVEDMPRMIPSAISLDQGGPAGRILELMEALVLCMEGMALLQALIQAAAVAEVLTTSTAEKIIMPETEEAEEAVS